MKLEGITAKQKRKFVRTTDSNHDLPVKENKLNQEFVAAMPDEKWANGSLTIHRYHLHLDHRRMAVFSSSTGLDLAHPELSEVRFPVEWWAG